jgi:hypothetical protein
MRTLIAMALSASVLLGAAPALATAIVNVQYAFAYAYVWGAYNEDSFLPGAAFDVTCNGQPVAGSFPGCDVHGQLLLSRSTPGQTIETVEEEVTLGLTLPADIADFPWLVVGIEFSSFNPGGSEIGASVDDPAHEFASFASQAGFIGLGFDAFDSHACATSLSPSRPAAWEHPIATVRCSPCASPTSRRLNCCSRC